MKVHKFGLVISCAVALALPAYSRDLTDCEATATVVYQITYIKKNCPLYELLPPSMALMATQYKLFEVGRCSKSELSATQYSTMAKLMDDDPKLAALVQSGKNDAVVRHVCEGFSANLNGASFLVKGPMMVRPDIDYDPDRD